MKLDRPFKYLLLVALIVVVPVVVPAADSVPDEIPEMPLGWPREVVAGETTFVIYQPQVDAWDGYLFEAHSAVAVQEAEAEAPLYGVISFSARTQVDKTERLVIFDRLEIIEAHFPSVEDRQEALRETLQGGVADVVRTISLDRAEAGMALLRAEMRSDEVPVLNQAPTIVFSDGPTVLVYVDGDPVYRQVEGTDFERILNTRPLVLRDEAGIHWLHLMDGFMTAPSLEGPWSVAPKTKKKLKKAMKKTLEEKPADLLEGGEPEGEEGQAQDKPSLEKGPVPAIVVATEPTEVIAFKGEPNYVPIEGTQLLFADNTGGHVFRDLEDQTLYVLISGRWFRAASDEGPWQYVAQDALPADFAVIPDESPKENVKASVAGTAQAQEAVIANSIPETAEVSRSSAKFQPQFDGKPKLVPIEGTDLLRVENSPDPIIQVGATEYYALHDGVWFISEKVYGPWKVATSIPAEIYSIPASSPIHNVTYVKVYESTPEVVVVGYTPGYYGTVVSENVVVYGTGYPYSPWVGSSWYGYPMTYGWGAGVTYSPWGGWSFTFGVSYGWGYWGSPWYGPYASPYWGPYYGYGYGYGYGYPYYGGVAYGARGGAVAWGPGGWAGTTGNVYHNWGSTTAVTRTSGGYNAWTGTGWRNQVGTSYNSRTGTLAAGQRAAVGNVYTGDYAYGKRGVAGNKEAGIVAGGKKGTVGNVDTGNQVTAGRGAVYNPGTGNSTRVGGIKGEQGGVGRVGDNVYGSKDGSVYKRNGQGDWEQMGGDRTRNSVQDADRIRSLEGQYGARATGNQRSDAYSRSRSSAGSYSRGSYGGSGGMRRGGGGRRR